LFPTTVAQFVGLVCGHFITLSLYVSHTSKSPPELPPDAPLLAPLLEPLLPPGAADGGNGAHAVHGSVGAFPNQLCVS